jgi:hypothetical protein
MQKTRPPAVITALALLASSAAVAAPPADGSVRALGATFEAYDEATATWLAPEAFWDAFAHRAGGRDWGRGSEYPPYAEVGEFDTFRVEIAGQACLMQFFHSRWRRANDVQRWDDRFNQHAACPRVFD